MTLIQRIQKLKAKKGFTLVELIVVIAILAVLMAILIPTMMNFVEDSRIKSANSTAKTLSDLTKNYVSKTESAGTGIKKGDAGTLNFTYSVSNSTGREPEFTVSTVAPDGWCEADGEKAWIAGLQAFLKDQMPNAKDNSHALIEVKKGAVVQTFYSASDVLGDGDGDSVVDDLIEDISEGKNGDGDIIGTNPIVNETADAASSDD